MDGQSLEVLSVETEIQSLKFQIREIIKITKPVPNTSSVSLFIPFATATSATSATFRSSAPMSPSFDSTAWVRDLERSQFRWRPASGENWGARAACLWLATTSYVPWGYPGGHWSESEKSRLSRLVFWKCVRAKPIGSSCSSSWNFQLRRS